MKEIYEYINIDKDHIPGAIQELPTGVVVYFTDEFFSYSYRFFIEQLLMGLSGPSKDKKYLETISEYFRQGTEEMLMSNIVLNT